MASLAGVNVGVHGFPSFHCVRAFFDLSPSSHRRVYTRCQNILIGPSCVLWIVAEAGEKRERRLQYYSLLEARWTNALQCCKRMIFELVCL
ncbi:hypothetical protein MPTK1_8g12630 [Marchantia polymorpha subsp. ruderalis]|nr:hypothetical protein MARPO_0083s0057 [Marchantia polymorpha]BBN19672.1 hypothetical protein Mp_8g12630 [Marchantia polymorpha subsp. ruderalis]|eukprot:PTQ34096.1 hypothetical protein MARPO_0083s0057 [Marchantia polymorpha]